MSRGFKHCPRCASELVTATHGDAPRLACPDARCGFVHWNNPVPVVAAVVEHEGKVILARNKNWPKKVFALITGFLEAGEDPAEGIVREVEEELGLKSRITEFIGLYSFPQMNQLIIGYAVQAEGEVVLGEELAEWRHFEHARIRPWPAATGLALRDWLRRKGFEVEVQERSPLQRIVNFLPLGDRIGTAGQPTKDQFGFVKEAGYEAVINLAPDDAHGALPDEAEIASAHGLEYVHIPVAWSDPKDSDLAAFFEAMDRFSEQKVFVHCAMNMRVSAFMFLWRVLRQGVPVPEAELALSRFFTPEGVWQDFIDRNLRAG